MSLLPVLQDPNVVLREIAAPFAVAEIGTPRVQELIDNMVQTMHASNGVGIAGPQVGVKERIIIVETGNGPEAFLNPEIISASPRMVNSEEGCLSIPGVFGIVKRHRAVTVRALDRHGREHTLQAKGLPAIIFQHEIDHLNGILFIDKVEKITSPQRL